MCSMPSQLTDGNEMGLKVYSVYSIDCKGVSFVLHGKTITVWCSVKDSVSQFLEEDDQSIKHWCSYVDKVLSHKSTFSLDTSVKHVFAYVAPQITEMERDALQEREKARLDTLDTKYAHLVDSSPSVYSLTDLLLDASGLEDRSIDASELID